MAFSGQWNVIGMEQVENIEFGIQKAIDLEINPNSVTMAIGD